MTARSSNSFVHDAALVQLGADLQFLPQASIGIAYSGQLAATANDQSVKGNFTWRF
jgi:outer membrane autotransporter protein